MIGSSGLVKTDTLHNLIKDQPDIDKIYLYARNLFEAIYKLLINKRESVDLNHCDYSKAFVEY